MVAHLLALTLLANLAGNGEPKHGEARPGWLADAQTGPKTVFNFRAGFIDTGCGFVRCRGAPTWSCSSSGNESTPQRRSEGSEYSK